MCGCQSSFRKTLYSLWKDQSAPFIKYSKRFEVFTAKCRNKPRVSTVGDALLDLPLNVHMCQTPFNGHSADNGGFTETVVSSIAHEVRTAALPSIDSTAGSSCSRVRPLVRQFCGFWLLTLGTERLQPFPPFVASHV